MKDISGETWQKSTRTQGSCWLRNACFHPEAEHGEKCIMMTSVPCLQAPSFLRPSKALPDADILSSMPSISRWSLLSFFYVHPRSYPLPHSSLNVELARSPTDSSTSLFLFRDFYVCLLLNGDLTVMPGQVSLKWYPEDFLGTSGVLPSPLYASVHLSFTIRRKCSYGDSIGCFSQLDGL